MAAGGAEGDREIINLLVGKSQRFLRRGAGIAVTAEHLGKDFHVPGEQRGEPLAVLAGRQGVAAALVGDVFPKLGPGLGVPNSDRSFLVPVIRAPFG